MSNAETDEFLKSIEKAADDFDQLALNVGYFVMLWANAEQWLDMCVAVVYRGLGGDVRVKRMPKNLQPRLEFLEDCFDALPALARLRGRARRVVSGFKKLSSTRHELIHGAIRDAFMTGTKYRFYKFELIDGKIHETRTFTLELTRQAPKLHEQALLLEQRTMDLFYRVHALWKRGLLKEPNANAKGAPAPRFVDLPPERVLMRKRQAGTKARTT
jgi:hypothetical protein